MTCSIIVDHTHHVTPSKIVCVGRNYVAHIQELNNAISQQMVLFCKPNSAITTALHAMHDSEILDYEGELCFMVNKGQFSALGFGFDLTKRRLQGDLKQQGLPWERAKAFNGSAVFSQFISIAKLPEQISFQLSKNNHLVQSGDSQMMIYQPHQILSEINRFMTLNDGDIVMTGTPAGVGPIAAHDHLSVNVALANKTVIQQDWIAQ